ncbi:hypothetical protein ABS764_07265 [Flavobacterium sp. ST-87]|uniref:DoxX-like family protein n=1 Tax=Flavobacterium plantiphilum TaxID=3163297 RepID=A0ABW8XSN2_9FLAO
MYTLALCLSLISIFCLLTLSDRVEVDKKGLMLFLKTKKTLSLLLAGLAFLFSTLIFITKVGSGVGIFTSLSLWMVLGCLVILFTPLNIIRQLYLIVGALVLFSIEFLMQFF